MDVPTIHAERLDLVSMSPAVMEALTEGRQQDAEAALGAAIPDEWPTEGDVGFLVRRLEQMGKDPGVQRWLARALVLREEGAMIGHAGFHGLPGTQGLAPGKAELGYTVFPEHRGRGYATEAADALMGWAEGQGIHDFVASVSPGNAPSLAIVHKLGFVQTGDQWDEEDGLELVFELGRRAAV
ncbi:MAG TPA: GNAT family N-acetyltransferase [Gaiellaceae bacterium]|jgi:RimJ/RimL family protein N-acetyltransferase|nr:GNAT family N-acetyltransferase [Gaiellaceae bacterium]